MREERDQAIDVAREQYDPSVYQPQLNLARERATEGISEGQESLQRRRALEQIFRPQDTAIYGGNQARAIAGQQQRNQQAQQAFSDFQSRLTEADLQAQRQGQQQFAQTRSQQLQTQAQQDAAIEQAELQYQQELERRRQSIGSTIGNLAGTVAGTALGGPLAGAAVGGGLGAIFGGGSGALTGAGAGATTGMTQQRLDEFNANQQARQEAGTQNQTPNWMGMLGGYDTGQQQTQPQQQTPNWMGMLGGFDQVQPQQTQTQQPQQAPQTPFISPQQPQDEVIPANLPSADSLENYFMSQQQQQEPLSREQFERQQALQAIGGASAFGGYGQQGEGQRVWEGVQATGRGLYDLFSGIESAVDWLNPITSIGNIIEQRKQREYQQYLQNQ